MNLAAFFDTRRPFVEYLRQEGVPEACRKANIRQRNVPRVLPAVSELISPNTSALQAYKRNRTIPFS